MFNNIYEYLISIFHCFYIIIDFLDVMQSISSFLFRLTFNISVQFQLLTPRIC